MAKTNITRILYFVWICMCTSYTSQADPLEGSKRTFPGDYGKMAKYVYYGDKDLTKLLDVGADRFDAIHSISYVPPLDGTPVLDTIVQEDYSMKFVLFDLQLVELKSFDALGGSFQVELQMILYWVDSIYFESNGTYDKDCRFLCDTNSPGTLCCDNIWVPPLHLPRCDIHKVQSSTPTPYIAYSTVIQNLSYEDCLNGKHDAECYWRRLWYLNIDVTCRGHTDFHNFPFDVQRLTIEILNPYASRTWFQLTKGFLQDNLNEDINSINPDGKVLGWSMQNLGVSGTCGTSEKWKQTFLTQDSLLVELSDKSNPYKSQYDDIIKACSSTMLECSKMEDFDYNSGKNDYTSITIYDELYKAIRDKYEERVNSTLENYKQCINKKGINFSWNKSIFNDDFIEIDNFGSFSTSSKNIHRSFSILDLKRGEEMSKVWFPCAISATANLTTPGIQVTILVQRYKMFYLMKLVLPTIVCVAFSFTAFGLHPKNLVGRLTVVVPSAIALTALQSFVVSTEIPPVAYIAPSTYLFLLSYIAQLLISFESLLVRWLDSQKNSLWRLKRQGTTREGKVQNAKNKVSNEPYFQSIERGVARNLEGVSDTPTTNEEGIEITQGRITMSSETMPHELSSMCFHKSTNDQMGQMNGVRKFDLALMVVFGMLYILTILLCLIPPVERSSKFKKTIIGNFISLWP